MEPKMSANEAPSLDENISPKPLPYGPQDLDNSLNQALDKIREWLKPYYSGTNLDNAIVWKDSYSGQSGTPQSVNDFEARRIRFKLWTENNEYTIVVNLKPQLRNSYMGASVSTRKKRAGEHWNRGNDLPDGKFSDELWQSIKERILKYEFLNKIEGEWKRG